MIRRLVVLVIGGMAGAFLVDRWLGGLSVDSDGRPIRTTIRTRVEIDAPIAATWAVLADIERQPEWMADMKTVRLMTTGPVGVGTRAEARIRIFGIGVVDPVEVVEYAPPHRFGIRHDGLFSGDGLITLDTVAGGRRTRVQWEERLVPPILPNLGALLEGAVLGRIFQADLERLRAIVEAASGDRSGTMAIDAEVLEVEAVHLGADGHGVPSAG